MLYKLFLAPRSQPSYAGQSHTQARSSSSPPASHSGFETQSPQGNGVSSLGYASESEINTPEWFDKTAFIENAVAHFKTLQLSWDRQDWSEIARFTSPALLEELKANRSVLPDDQKTDVVSVMAELVDFIENETETVVSLNFHGWIRENDADNTAEFSEVWHLAKPSNSGQGGWSLVGIQQA